MSTTEGTVTQQTLLSSQVLSKSSKPTTRDLETDFTQRTPSIGIKHTEVTGKHDAKRHQIFPVKPGLAKDTQVAHQNTRKTLKQTHQFSSMKHGTHPNTRMNDSTSVSRTTHHIDHSFARINKSHAQRHDYRSRIDPPDVSIKSPGQRYGRNTY